MKTRQAAESVLQEQEASASQRLFKPRTVAEMLDIAPATVYHLVACGELPSVRIGKAIRISKEAIDRWIREQEERTRAA